MEIGHPDAVSPLNGLDTTVKVYDLMAGRTLAMRNMKQRGFKHLDQNALKNTKNLPTRVDVAEMNPLLLENYDRNKRSLLQHFKEKLNLFTK